MSDLTVTLTVQREDWEGSAPPLTTLARDRHEFTDPAEAEVFAERVRAWLAKRPHPDDELASGEELLHYYAGGVHRAHTPTELANRLEEILG